MKKYIIFDLDGTLIESHNKLMILITKYFNKNFGLDEEKVKYLFSTTRGTALSKQVEILLEVDENKANQIANDIYKEINILGSARFFSGVPEKILELSKKYKLFLSTGNSTTFAENNLKEGGIYDCFEYILGSEKIYKSEEHIKFFKEIVLDSDFEKNAIFVGDGEKDREIAKISKIDFIHIDENLENKFNDKFEIKSVAEIDKILKKIE